VGKLEDLRPLAAVPGILPGRLVTVDHVQWFGSNALAFIYKTARNTVSNKLNCRDDEPRIVVRTVGQLAHELCISKC
jgi:hypothetical protein